MYAWLSVCVCVRASDPHARDNTLLCTCILMLSLIHCVRISRTCRHIHTHTCDCILHTYACTHTHIVSLLKFRSNMVTVRWLFQIILIRSAQIPSGIKVPTPSHRIFSWLQNMRAVTCTEWSIIISSVTRSSSNIFNIVDIRIYISLWILSVLYNLLV